MPAFAEPIPDLHVTSTALSTVRADLLAVPVFEEDDRDADLAAASKTLAAALAMARTSGEFRGRPFEMLLERVDAWQRHVAAERGGKRSEFSS